MRSFLERIRAGERLVGDGAMGTMLMAAGLEPGGCPEELNLTRPDLLRRIARQYAEAGADVVQTNTFGGSPAKLAHYGLDGRVAEINRAAVQAVRQGVADVSTARPVHVSGSMGPSGRMLAPHGDTSAQELAAGFARQAAALVAAGVDVICVETMTDLQEAQLAIQAAREAAAAAGREIGIMATMTFDSTPRGWFTIMGVDIAAAAAGLAAAGADLVGSNCGNGSRNMVAIAREFRQATDRPLIFQANAGLPELERGRVVYRETPEFMAEQARELFALGASVVGGCCGTTPEHVRALRAVVERLPSRGA
jgi:5-methyltetrahydrofolate--homocysteine methyltransferase